MALLWTACPGRSLALLGKSQFLLGRCQYSVTECETEQHLADPFLFMHWRGVKHGPANQIDQPEEGSEEERS